ncbi:sensor histidine kinase [Caenispirillum bisanense]|uniref:sensor histidine kinase n=1 Tax=Caenispirillum bisanense TaxID=414052 RepID=UPI0031E306C3
MSPGPITYSRRASRRLVRVAVGLALVLVVALMAAGAMVLDRERQTALALATAAADHLARQIASEAAGLALLGDKAAVDANRVLFLHEGRPQAVTAELDLTATLMPGLRAVSVFDHLGEPVAASRRMPLLPASLREELLALHRDAWRDLVVTPGEAVGLGDTLLLSRARWDDGRAFQGYGMAVVDVSRIRDWLAEQPLGRDASVALLLPDGRLVSLLAGRAPDPLAAHLRPLLDARWTGGDAMPVDGDVIVGGSVSRDFPLVGVVERPLAVVLADWTLRSHFAAGAAVMLLAVVALFLVAFVRMERLRRASEADLRLSRHRLTAALENGNLSLWDWTVEQEEAVFGDGLAAMLGAGPGDSEDAGTGPPLSTMAEFRARIHPDDVAAVTAALEDHVAGRSDAYAAEYRLCRADGSITWIADRGRAVDRDDDGRARRIIGVHADITARKQAETALRQKTRALADSNRDLEQFAYIASHDLQEPLRMVSSYLTLLLRREGDRLTPQGLAYAHTAVNGAARMSRLIRDLLEYSRVGTRGGAFTAFPLTEAAAEALDNLRITASEAGADIVIADSLPAVTGDRGQIVRLLQNLLGNALKYRHPERPPQVRVEGQRLPDGRVCLSVSDNGIGIDPQHFEQVFQIFRRLHAAAEYEGTGIGLAVCRRIVDRHGGRIWIDSAAGAGATFHVELPPPLPDAATAVATLAE